MTEAKKYNPRHSPNVALIATLCLAAGLLSALMLTLNVPDIRAQTQPTLVSISPDIITVGTQDVLTITGSGFEDTPTVTVDSQVLIDVGFVSTTTLTATVPPSLPVGVYTVTVTNPGGLSNSLSGGLTVQNPAPTLTALAPDSGPNNLDTRVVITGTHFVPTPMVTLGDVQLEDVTWMSSTRLTALVPWGLYSGTYDLIVANPGPGIPLATLTDAFTATQAIGTWTTVGPYGGSVHSLAMDKNISSTLYAGLGLAGADGFFKSEDGGRIWYNAFPGKISTHTPLAGFALKPGDPQTIYLSGRVDTGEMLFRSANEGEDWEVIRGGDSGFYAIGVSPGNPEYLYAGSGSTIVLSTDGGDHWTPADGGIPHDAAVSMLAVHPVTPTIAYAGVEFGRLYKTTDGGTTWSQIMDWGGGWWSILAIDPHAPDRVYASGWHTDHFFARSLDGGQHWEMMTLEPGSLSANDIAFHPTISGTLYVSAPGVYSSTNAGATWNKVPIPDTASEGWSLLLHPQTGLPMYIGHNGRGVLYSDNGGADWQVRSDGLAGLRPHEIATSPADPHYIYVGADEAGGVVSNNGGSSWLTAEAEGLDRGISVAVHPYTPTIAYLGARRAVYKTTDGGQTWTRHELTGLPDNNEMRMHAIAIDQNNPAVMYAGPGTWDFAGGPEYGWLYRSLDAGETWNPLAITFPISPVTDIEVDPTDSQTIYVATGRRFLDSTDRGTGILKTTDGGASWAFINEGLPARSISRLAINPDDPQVLYAGAVLRDDLANSGVYKSVDGGENWSHLIGWLQISGLAIDPLMTGTVYIGTCNDGLYRSDDAGMTWVREGGPLGQLSIESLHITTAPSRTIIYAGVVGDLLIGETTNTADLVLALTSAGQFYGGGVYQLTIDRRPLSNHIYLPLVMKN
jgi:photosystem II stability/assembly factor-like uncharacterized protein